jgi:hypothetical protein
MSKSYLQISTPFLKQGGRKNGFRQWCGYFAMHGLTYFWGEFPMNYDIDPSDLPEFYDSEFETNRREALQRKWDLWDSQADDMCSDD